MEFTEKGTKMRCLKYLSVCIWRYNLVRKICRNSRDLFATEINILWSILLEMLSGFIEWLPFKAGSDLIFKKASWVLPVQSQNTYCGHSIWQLHVLFCHIIIIILSCMFTALFRVRSELPFTSSLDSSQSGHSIISGVLIPGSKVRDVREEVKEEERGSMDVLLGWLPPCLFSWSLSTFWKSHEVSVKTVHWNQSGRSIYLSARSTFDQTLRPQSINYSTLPKCTVVNAKLTPASEKSWGRREEERHCHIVHSQFSRTV